MNNAPPEVVVITGASAGVGRATACAFARRGACIGLLARGLRTLHLRTRQAGLNALYGQPVNDWKNYDGYIDAVTIAALRDFARKYFQKTLRTQLVVKA